MDEAKNVVYQNQEIEITTYSKSFCYNLQIKNEDETLSLENLSCQIISDDFDGGVCFLEGANLNIALTGSIKVKFSYVFESETYDFYVNFIYLG